MNDIIVQTQRFLNWFLPSNLVEDGIQGNNTNKAITLAINKFAVLFKERGWDLTYTFKFIGIRTNLNLDNTFDDWFVIICNGTLIALPASTTSGTQGIWKYLNRWFYGKTGVGSIAHNQQIDYLLVEPNPGNSWSMWTGGNGFLYQDKPIDLYLGVKQVNNEWIINTDNLVKGTIGGGFNVHSWANYNLSFVNNLSEGCQVTKIQYWQIIFPILRKYAINNRITYSLIKL